MSARFVLPALLSFLLLAGCTKKETETGADQDQDTSTVYEGPRAHGKVVTLTESNFHSAVGEGLVLVDFWATWCAPCQFQSPIVEELAGQVKGVATIAKVDWDKAQATARKYRIDIIPTLMLFKDGKLIQQFVGVTEGKTLLAAINAAK